MSVVYIIIFLRHEVQALRVAPVDADDTDKNLVATLYMNRASVLHVSLILRNMPEDNNIILNHFMFIIFSADLFVLFTYSTCLYVFFRK